jgi:rod shape-determining protein MreC
MWESIMIAVRVKIVLCTVIFITVYFFMGYQAVYKKSGNAETVASLLMYPFLKFQQIVVSNIDRCKNFWSSNDLLQEKIAALQEQNNVLQAEIIQTYACNNYNENTHELIDFKKRYEAEKSLLTQVILKQFSDKEHSLLVDCGSLHGCEVDMVAVYKSCLLGRVECVYPLYSKIRLITDKCCKVAAYCRSSKARGIHEGCNSSYSSLQFVSHLSQIAHHDILISSGEGLLFPQGFGIGRIATFQQQGLYYAITVKPLLKFEELEYCYLIKKGQE